MRENPELTKKEKAELIRTMRRERVAAVRERLKTDHALGRLQGRLRRRQERHHAPILRKAAELMGTDPELLQREHRKGDQLIKKQLEKEKEKLSAASRELKRRQKKGRTFARRAARDAQRTSPLFSTGTASRGGITCLWRADSDERPVAEGTPTAEAYSYRYGNSDGDNTIRYRLLARGTNEYDSDFGWRNYQFNFYYEQPASGVIGITTFVEPLGVASVWSSASGGCGYNPPSLAFALVRAYIAASGVDPNGNPYAWPPATLNLFHASESDGAVKLQPIQDAVELEYTSYLPVIGGTPIVISVGVETAVSVWGVGESELELFSPSYRGVNFPFVSVRQY